MFPLIFREEGTEKRQLVPSPMRPNPGWNPQPRRVPWPGMDLQPSPAREPQQRSNPAKPRSQGKNKMWIV